MRRPAFAVPVCPLALAAAAGLAQPVFRAEIGMVVLHATVRNAHRELVTDLGPDAFTVYENGTAQAIKLFRRGDVAVSQGILLDNRHSMRGQRATVESAALAVLRSSSPQDQTFLMNFADKARIDVPLTNDVGALVAAVHRSDSIGGTALRDAVKSAEEYLNEHASKQRKVLVVITDGNDNASATTEDHLERQAEQSGIVVYALGLLNRDEAAKAARAREVLERLAESSGGVAYYPTDVQQADRSAVDVARQVRHVYTIGYAPLAQAFDGCYRKLRVVARGRERLWVKTRPGYRATAGNVGSPERAGARQ